MDVEFKKNLMRCSGNGSHLKELMVRLSREILESHDFKTNVFCVNAGHVEAGQLFYVIIEDEKNKAQALQKMQEDLNNLMMKEEGQLLNNVVVNYAGIGQPLKFEAKEKQLLKVAIEDFVDDNQLLKGVNLEGSQDK